MAQASASSGTLNTLRRRGMPPRAATYAEGSPRLGARRNSTLSDSISEARASIRSSTDDLFLPRVHRSAEASTLAEESHWQSAPLALALLPAIAGVLFRDGSAFVTDVTLLGLAAIFLNWSVRLPWYGPLLYICMKRCKPLTNQPRDWYRSAQAIHREESGYETNGDVLESDLDEIDEATEWHGDSKRAQPASTAASAASSELRFHELVALTACFIFPVIGTWVLHAIRSGLSRPSEGLVSNYNLTIFLLASEIRPFAHLLKLVQARTLHLQRIVATSSSEDETIDATKFQDVSKRLEELEAHVAEAAAARLALSSTTNKPDSDHPQSPDDRTDDAASLIAQTITETRRVMQPEIEALNRAVRRYEKRTAVCTMHTDTRLQQLEAQTRDALALAAAAQSSTSTSRHTYAFTLLNWACACIVIPAQLVLSLLSLPGRAASHCILAAQRVLTRRPTTAAAAPKPRPKASKGKSATSSRQR